MLIDGIRTIPKSRFKDLYELKNHCEAQNNCSTCKIGREQCKLIASGTVEGCEDISTMGIGRLNKRYIAFKEV